MILEQHYIECLDNPIILHCAGGPVLRRRCCANGFERVSDLLGGTTRGSTPTPPSDTREERQMCYAVTCPSCGKTTWDGCGRHVDDVMRSVAAADRCRCEPVDAPSSPAVRRFWRR